MTTDNGTAGAVAEPEVSTAPVVEEESAAGAAAETEAASAPEPSAESEATEQAAEFKVEDLPEYKQIMGEEPTKTEPAVKAGVSVEEVQAQAIQQGWKDYASVMQMAETDYRASLKNAGFSDEESASLWQANRAQVQAVARNNEVYTAVELNRAAQAALGDEEQKTFFGRVYETYGDFVKGLVETGAARERKAFEEKVGKGEYVTREKARQLATAAHNAGRAIAERNGGSASGGQTVNGAAAGGSFANVDALYDAWNNRQISRETYAREYKRLTGREPE